MPVSAVIPGMVPILVPKALGIFAPAGEATDLTRLDPRPMPEACPEGLLLDELFEHPIVSNIS